MAFNDETTQGFLQSRLGQSRLFLRGGVKRKLLPGESYKYLGLTDIAPPTITRGDKITFELPSDTNGDTTTTVTAAPGPYDTITMAFTQAMSRGMTEGWWTMIRERAPASILIPVGHDRLLSDVADYTAAWLCDNVLLKSVGPDNNANPSDEATTALPFNLTGELEVEGEDVHRIKTATVSNQTIASLSDVAGVAYRDTEDGVEYFAVTKGSSTAEPAIALRDIDGDWSALKDITTETPSANSNRANDATIVGSFILIPTGEQSGTSTTGGHWVVDADSVSGTVDSQLISYGDAHAIYAPSSGTVIIVGEDNASVGKIWKSNGVKSIPRSINHGITLTGDPLRTVHGIGQQVVAGGEDATVLVSEDLGETWKKVTVTGLNAAANVNFVRMIDRDVILVGTNVSANTNVLYYSSNFGNSWKTISHGSGFIPQDMQFLRTSTGYSAAGYMVGSSQTNTLIARTLDGGTTWQTGKPAIDVAVGGTASQSALTSLAVRTANEVIISGKASNTAGYVGLALES